MVEKEVTVITSSHVHTEAATTSNITNCKNELKTDRTDLP